MKEKVSKISSFTGQGCCSHAESREIAQLNVTALPYPLMRSALLPVASCIEAMRGYGRKACSSCRAIQSQSWQHLAVSWNNKTGKQSEKIPITVAFETVKDYTLSL